MPISACIGDFANGIQEWKTKSCTNQAESQEKAQKQWWTDAKPLPSLPLKRKKGGNRELLPDLVAVFAF